MIDSTSRLPGLLLVLLLLALTAVLARGPLAGDSPAPADLRASSRLAPAGAASAERAIAAPDVESTALPAPRVEVAFVLDTTGSMGGLIEGAKQKIWSVANQIASAQPTPEIRIGLVGYRDRGDDYVTRIHDLTDDLDSLHGWLLAFSANGGGDSPESVNQALREAVHELSWSRDPGAYRVVFLVGDAPPHLDYADDVPYGQTADVARRREIVVNTIQCGAMPGTEEVWRDIARLGGGGYVAIAQDGGVRTIAAPQDAELARLNRELAATVLGWGSSHEQEALRGKLRRSLEAAPAAQAARLSYLRKTSGKAASGRSDLVDAVRLGEADVAALEDEALPEELRPLTRDQREERVRELSARRAELQAQVDRLARERDDFLTEEARRRGADGFDEQVLALLRSQAGEKGLSWHR